MLVEDDDLLDVGLPLGLPPPAGAPHPGPHEGEAPVGPDVGAAGVVAVGVAVGELGAPAADPGEVPEVRPPPEVHEADAPLPHLPPRALQSPLEVHLDRIIHPCTLLKGQQSSCCLL